MSSSTSREPWRVVGSFSQRLRLDEEVVDFTSSLAARFRAEAVPLLLYDAHHHNSSNHNDDNSCSSCSNGMGKVRCTREVPRYVACKLPRCSLEAMEAETSRGRGELNATADMSVLCATPTPASRLPLRQNTTEEEEEEGEGEGERGRRCSSSSSSARNGHVACAESTVLVQQSATEPPTRKAAKKKRRQKSEYEDEDEEDEDGEYTRSHNMKRGKGRKKSSKRAEKRSAQSLLLVTTPPNVSQTELIVPALLILADMIISVTTIAIHREAAWFIVTSCLLIFLPDLVTLVLIFCRNVYCITAALHILLWTTVIMFYVLAQDTLFLLGHTALMIFLVLFTLRLRRSYYQAIFVM